MPPRPSEEPPAPTFAGSVARKLWLAGGLLLVGIGGVGIVVPGLPTTVFFIGAAACFARSSPRLERWVLGLPRVGPLVRDYRDGLGMPRRTKWIAIAMIAIAVGLSVLAIPSAVGRALALALALVGIVYILLRVPTREQVLAEREIAAED